MNNLYRKEQLSQYGGLLYTIFVILLIASLVYFFFVPKYHEINALRDTIASQERELADLRSYLDYLTELANSTLDIEQSIIDYALPSENDVISFIVTYEGLGKFAGVSLEPLNISPGLVRSAKKIESDKSESNNESDLSDSTSESKETPIEVKNFDFSAKAAVDGEAALQDFVNEIYQTRRFFSIKTLNWTRSETNNQLDVTFAMSTYYLPPFTVKPSPDLVKQGKNQESFFEKLKNAKVYEQLVLEGVAVGKSDLFSFE